MKKKNQLITIKTNQRKLILLVLIMIVKKRIKTKILENPRKKKKIVHLLQLIKI